MSEEITKLKRKKKKKQGGKKYAKYIFSNLKMFEYVQIKVIPRNQISVQL